MYVKTTIKKGQRMFYFLEIPVILVERVAYVQ